MDLSWFLTNLPLILKVATFLDVRTGNCNRILVSLRILAILFTTSFVLKNLVDNGIGFQSFGQTHDLLMFLMLLITEFIFATNKKKVSLLVKLLLEPIPDFGPNNEYEKEIQDYKKNIQRCGMVVIIFVITCFFWALTPLTSMFNKRGQSCYQCFGLPLEWIPNYTESMVVMIITYTVAVLVFLTGMAVYFSWFMTMSYAVLRIKLEIRLLVHDLNVLDEKVKQFSEENLNSLVSNRQLRFCNQYKNSPKQNYPLFLRYQLGIEEQRSWRRRKSLGMRFRECCRRVQGDGVRQECSIRVLKKAIERHLKIMKLVRLTDECFHLPVMLYSQFGVLVPVLTIPHLGFIMNPLTPEYLYRNVYGCAEIIGGLSCIAIFNLCGQIVLDESETLRHALYSCSWTDKSPEFCRYLLVMQTMATRPLRLTSGFIFTLGMESLSKILSAFYSYANLLQTVRNKHL